MTNSVTVLYACSASSVQPSIGAACAVTGRSMTIASSAVNSFVMCFFISLFPLDTAVAADHAESQQDYNDHRQ